MPGQRSIFRVLVAAIALLPLAGAIATAAPQTPEVVDERVEVSAGWVADSADASVDKVPVRFRIGGCYQFGRVTVGEDDESVTISVIISRPADPTPCPYPATTGTAVVQLEEPLGERELRHGEVAPDTPVSEPPRAGGRLWGASRIETAVAISQARFPNGAQVAYLARSDDPADATVGAGLADGPLLLVPRCGEALPKAVEDEIRRLDPQRITLLGGSTAVCEHLLDVATAVSS